MPEILARLNRLLHRGPASENLSEAVRDLQMREESVLLVGHVAHIGPPATRRDFILWGHFDPEQKAYLYRDIAFVATTRRIFWIGLTSEKHEVLESIPWDRISALRLEKGSGGRIGIEIVAGRDETTWVESPLYSADGIALSVTDAQDILDRQRA